LIAYVVLNQDFKLFKQNFMWILGVFVAGFIYELLTSKDTKVYSVYDEEQKRMKERARHLKEQFENEENQKWQ
jgi:hypothetical protein